MRVRNWRGKFWAARLGLLALVLNALVPVHLAFDLAEAFEPAHRCGAHAEVGDAERSLLALLSGHRDADGQSDEHHKHHACPVCSALGSLAGLAAPSPTALPVPLPTGLRATLSVIEGESFGTPAAYRSRAPPSA
jgi:hypothetical protein